ncbi:MAG TPA: squalene--hopene cyclase [Phycisphaerales bacterium]|nr:squalene--hopene cyclase [Phycisphaerales bacterium]
MIDVNKSDIDNSLELLRRTLLAERGGESYWRGELSSSALATATAVCALSLVDANEYESQIEKGLGWLCENRNADGGFGDSILSESNLTTTVLVRAVFEFAEDSDINCRTKKDAEKWISERAGGVSYEHIANAIDSHYGKDKTFSVPILTMCALSGWFGTDEKIWRRIKALPFELAVFPHEFFRWLRLHVVSYALPALIAMGQVRFYKLRPRNPITRFIRGMARRKTFAVLGTTQPGNGGFLEATPLTSFVVMAIAACGYEKSDVVERSVKFILGSARDDGSWAIDTDLATWVTTLSVNALAAGSESPSAISMDDRRDIQEWLLGQQFRKVHPFTNSPAGGWGWTDLPGAVPDADDTAGALVALANLQLVDEPIKKAAAAGAQWLIGVQNTDGGIATFCPGWSKLPFDRSATDLTGHTIKAFACWLETFDGPLRKRVEAAIAKALGFLKRNQHLDGSWVPLWFGNENTPEQQNPVYGTARVLSHLSDVSIDSASMLERAAGWLMGVQNDDGGFGGGAGVSSSIEETALALDGLAAYTSGLPESDGQRQKLEQTIGGAAKWLIEHTAGLNNLTPNPIGLYFASLWYYEKLYPVIFSISALQRVREMCG